MANFSDLAATAIASAFGSAVRAATTIAVVLATLYVLWCWYRPAPAISTAVFAPAKISKQVGEVPMVAVPVASIQVIPKAVAKKKLRLPQMVVDDPGKEVVSAIDIPPTRGGATSITLIDTRTGRTETLVRETPRPFLALEVATEVGMRYGLSTAGGQRIDLYARRDLARVGNVFIGVYGEANTRPEAKAMIDVSLRW